nr:glycoside hydrolase [Clostridia bacterium]
MDFKNVPSEYRPIPFWSWNEKLEVNETREQVNKMHDAGIGGFFMHARGGLETEYMGEEWFDNIEAGADEAAKLGMHPWAYDENGWPSGFGAGVVNGRGLKYQQKYLRCKEGEDADHENLIVNKDGRCFYYDVNPFYVDTLDGEVTEV